jgi:hypothetical protein
LMGVEAQGLRQAQTPKPQTIHSYRRIGFE